MRCWRVDVHPGGDGRRCHEKRRGMWWGCREEREVVQGVEFAPDTQEGGGEDYVFIPDSDEEDSEVQPNGAGDDSFVPDSFVPDSELLPNSDVEPVASVEEVGGFVVVEAEDVGGAVVVGAVVADVEQEGTKLEEGGGDGVADLATDEVARVEVDDAVQKNVDIRGHSQEDGFLVDDSSDDLLVDDSNGLEDWVMDMLLCFIPAYAQCVKCKRE